MTKRGSYKRAVRRNARESGRPYTEELAVMQREDLLARMGPKWHGREGLPQHLESHYGIRVGGLTQLSKHGGGVFRVDRGDGGPTWVARVLSRPMQDVEDDVTILRFLERHDFPAERLAHLEPTSVYDGQPVLVTEFVEGEPGEITAAHERALGDLLGRLHALPGGADLVSRGGGAFGHDPLRYGKPSEDLVAAAAFLAAVEHEVPADHRALFETLRERVAEADGCDDLPEALTISEMVGNHVRVTPDGRHVACEFEGAGRGPRLPAFAFLLEGGATANGGIDDAILEGIVCGYAAHIRLEPEELSRLAAAMWIRPLYFASLAFMHAMLRGQAPTHAASWLPDDERLLTIAAKAGDAFRAFESL